MPLFKQSPGIQIRAPAGVVGMPLQAMISLRCRAPVPVDHVEVKLSCEAVFRPPMGREDGEIGVSKALLFVQRAYPIRERVELAARTHEHLVTFNLPANVPGSYRSPQFTIVWQISVRVSIPWWPDPLCRFLLNVHSRSDSTIAPTPPRLYATHVNGPMGTSPYAEMSLTSTVIRPGDTLRGLISLANTAHHRYWLYLTLEQRLQGRFGGGRISSEQVVHTERLSPKVADNHPVPFAVPVPQWLIPGFSTFSLAMTWQLVCTVESYTSMTRRMIVPLNVVPTDAPVVAHMPAPSLAMIGSERREQAWIQAAAETGYTYDGRALVRQLSRCTLTIMLESGGAQGTRLIADARMDEVDIGMHVDGGQLRCRDPDQSSQLAEATDALIDKHRLAEASDTHVRYVVNDGGTRAHALVALARWFESLVARVLEVRAELPAPASVVHLQPAFERAASMLGARFVPAGMDVWGVRNDVPFSLETRWDGSGDYRNTTITVGSLLPIDGRFHGTSTPEAWPDELPEGLAELLDDVIVLVIWAWRIELHLPAVPADAPEGVDIDRLVDRVEALHAVGRRLSMRDGVYR